MANRLEHETSPYLLQHKDNPVDWYPWGEEALARAAAEDKPILLSIGYAACHWCHVMERESFEDQATAEFMNRHFVNVKVDREERPDLDQIYMEAVQALTGHGGWPMTVFLTPEGVPFYGGTYFPPQPRHGLPAFRSVLEAVVEAWRTRRAEIYRQGQELLAHINGAARLRAPGGTLTAELVDTALSELERSFDPQYGGFGGAPKFPQAPVLDLLLRRAARGDERAAAMVRLTLDRMAAGGIFDQLAGGFCRYSVDRYWVVPHFEKMLYDNAQLLRTYARAAALFAEPRYRRVAEMTATWLLTEMRDPAGGFWSSLDADSEGEEGRYYLWELDEVRAVCGQDAAAAIERFGFSEQGNFEGRNIPVDTGRGDDAAVERARAALLSRRAGRVRPATDTKVLAGWNGLAAAALAEAGRLLGRKELITAGAEALGFVVGHMKVDGRLMRSYRRTPEGPVLKQPGFVDDHAFVLEALLALYEATGNPELLAAATALADVTIELFGDDAGGFFATAADAEPLVTRPKDLFDNPLPAGNSVLALELQRLAVLTGQERYLEVARAALELVAELARRAPGGFGHALSAIDRYTSGSVEVVVVGQGADALAEGVRRAYVPNAVIVVSSEPERAVALTPLLRNREPLGGAATAYVCRNNVCDLPTTDASAMLELVRAAGAG
jgi:uncharacterized protein YyaL (SSP411 family)